MALTFEDTPQKDLGLACPQWWSFVVYGKLRGDYVILSISDKSRVVAFSPTIPKISHNSPGNAGIIRP